MDAFTITDYLLSAILGVLMFMIVIKASDKFLPAVLLCFLLAPGTRAADEQDIVDSVNAANSAITSAVNTVGSTESNSNFALWTIQSALSALNTEVTDQGYTLDNIYYYDQYNNSYLSTIATNGYYLQNIDSNTSALYTTQTDINDSLDDIYSSQSSIISNTASTAANTSSSLTKLDTIDASVQAVKAAIEACCYTEMAELQAINANTDNVEALLESLDESIGDFMAQEYLANSNRDDLQQEIIDELEAMGLDVSGIHDDTGELVTLTQTANSTLSSLLTAMDSIDSNTSTSGGGLTFDEIESDGLVVDDPLNFDDDFKDAVDNGFASEIQEASAPEGTDVGLLKTALGIDEIIDETNALSIPSNSSSLLPLSAVGTLDWSGDASLGSFDFVAAVDAYWSAIQPIILLLVTGFICYRMLVFTMIHTQKAMAS